MGWDGLVPKNGVLDNGTNPVQWSAYNIQPWAHSWFCPNIPRFLIYVYVKKENNNNNLKKTYLYKATLGQN